jgi:hypothetical protein
MSRAHEMALNPGDHYVAVAGSGENMLCIYGRVVGPGDLDEDERSALAANYAREPHIRYAEAFSEICPDGEFGDIDVRDVLKKISAEDFEILREQGWPSLVAEVDGQIQIYLVTGTRRGEIHP